MSKGIDLGHSGVTVIGQAELTAAAAKLRQAMSVGGGLGGAVAYAAKAYSQALHNAVHVDTGAYSAAQTYQVDGLTGRAFTGDKTNPKTGQLASVYGPYEEARGGSHAAYATTFQRDTTRIAGEALTILIGSLP